MKTIEKFISVIIQPNAYVTYKLHVYTRREIETFIKKTSAKLKKMKKANKFNIGPWCDKYAKCSKICAAKKKERLKNFHNVTKEF